MRAITERRIRRVFTGAPGDLLGLFNDNLLGTKLTPLVRTVAKRLTSGLTTGTPPISAGLYFLDDGTSLGDFWIRHIFLEFVRLSENFNPLQSSQQKVTYSTKSDKKRLRHASCTA